MVKVLNREAIQRMNGSTTGSVGSGGSSGGGGGISIAQVDAAYVSKAFFDQLFTVHGKRTYTDPETQEEVTEDVIISPNQIAEGEYSLSNVEVSVGLWTQQFLSALGLNSGGGGGGATALTDLVDVALSNPQNGQVLMYNSSTGKWYNGTVQSGGGGTVTSITAGTGLSGGTITSSGTIALSENTQTAIANGVTAYGWGDHAQAGYLKQSALTGYATQQWVGQQGFLKASDLNGYATQQWVGQQGFLKASDLNGYATQQWVQQQGYLTSHQSVDGTFWGQSWNNHGALSGSIDAGSYGGAISGFHSIELNNYGTLSGYGGFIDFHYNGSSADYTSRIIEDVSGRLFFDVSVGVRIGSVVLSWDSGNNALKIQNIDGTAANLYATGGVSALGMSAGVSVVDAMTFNSLSVNNNIKFNSSVSVIVGNSSQIVANASDSDCIYLLNYSGTSKITSNNYYYNQYDNVGLHGTNYNYDETWFIDPDGCAKFKRLYLDSTRYIYVNGGTLYYYNGSTSRQIAFA